MRSGLRFERLSSGQGADAVLLSASTTEMNR